MKSQLHLIWLLPQNKQQKQPPALHAQNLRIKDVYESFTIEIFVFANRTKNEDIYIKSLLL